LSVPRVAAAVIVPRQPAEPRLTRQARLRRVAGAPLFRWLDGEARLVPLAVVRPRVLAAPTALRQTDFPVPMSASRDRVVRCQIDET